jgi:hypothetical protein
MYTKNETKTKGNIDSECNIECCITSDLQQQLRKILDRYSKDLELYLQLVEEPLTANKLFTHDEIRNFMDKQKMLPLEKLVIMSSIMEKHLTLRFTGQRCASLPLEFTGNADNFLAQLHFNIYNVLALLGENSSSFERLDRPVARATKRKSSHAEKLTVDLYGLTGEASALRGAEPDLGEAVDVRSLDALVSAARYGGFTLQIVMESSKAA